MRSFVRNLDAKTITGIAGLVLVVLGLSYAYWVISRPPVDTTVAVEAPVAPVIKKVKKRTTPVKSVKTFAPEAKANLKLPPAVIASETTFVTGATPVAPSERRVTVSSVLDTGTGETTLFTKPEPLPWFAVEARGEARVDVGYKMQKGAPTPAPVARLSVTHNFVQVKGFHAGVNAAIDTDGEVFAGVGIGYRW